jgi:hypothetical protein
MDSRASSCLEELDPIDVLYLLFDLNKRLNKIILSMARIRQLFWMAQFSTGQVSAMNDEMLDRFCSFGLPRMHQNIQ